MSKELVNPMTAPMTSKQKRAIVAAAIDLAIAIDPDNWNGPRTNPLTAPIPENYARAVIATTIEMAVDVTPNCEKARKKFLAAMEEPFPGITRTINALRARVRAARSIASDNLQ